MIIKHGTTRVVILCGAYAFKFPTFRSWTLFLFGLLANMQEKLFSGVWEELCPVVFAIPGGFCTVMKRAQPIDESKWEELSQTIPEHIFNIAESKSINYGWLDGKIVAIDYGSIRNN
jgi:hypothetical protein